MENKRCQLFLFISMYGRSLGEEVRVSISLVVIIY